MILLCVVLFVPSSPDREREKKYYLVAQKLNPYL